MVMSYDTIAYIEPGVLAPKLRGTVKFRKCKNGTWVYVDIAGLPMFQSATANTLQIAPFGFHLHEGKKCGGGYGEEPFKEAGGHWNPDNKPHGNHAGDFPALFSNDGICKMNFFTNRFKPSDIIGKTIVIHQSPDDYKTQPSGNSGKRIGCGVIISG